MQSIAHAIREYDVNVVLSPFSIWSLMVLLAEISTDNSFSQLEKALRLPSDLTNVRSVYKQFQRLLFVNTSTIELIGNQALFTDINKPIDNDILDNFYEADYLLVNFQNRDVAAKTINNHIRFQTRGKIPDVIKKEHLDEGSLLLMSAIFFKGQWKVRIFICGN